MAEHTGIRRYRRKPETIKPRDTDLTAVAYEPGEPLDALRHIAGLIALSPPEMAEVELRSRGGRWVEKWEATRRLENFRLKTIPPEHPRFTDRRLWTSATQADLEECLSAVAQLAAEGRCAPDVPRALPQPLVFPGQWRFLWSSCTSRDQPGPGFPPRSRRIGA